MSNEEIQRIWDTLRTNLLEMTVIKKIYLERDGYGKIGGIILTMDDPVKTELKITGSLNGELKIELSQLEKVVTEVRKNYLDSSIPF